MASAWTPEEDALLTKAVNNYVDVNWDSIQKSSSLKRSRNACMVRWHRHIKPRLIIKAKFSQEEEDKIRHLYTIKGRQWTEIAKEFPGRSADDVKAFCELHNINMRTSQAWRTQQLVDDSQAGHNPDTTGKTSSIFAQGSGSSQFLDPGSWYEQGLGSYQLPGPGSMFAQGLVYSQFSGPNDKFEQGLGLYQLPGPGSMFAQGLVYSQFSGPNDKFEQGLGSYQLPGPGSMFAQGLVYSQFSGLNDKFEQGLGSYQLPDPGSKFAQGLVSSQFSGPNDKFEQGLGSYQLPDPGSKFAQGLGSYQLPDPGSKLTQGLGSYQLPDPGSMFAQGSGSSQFPAVFPSPFMQQHNNLDSTFSSTNAAGPALIDRYTGLSGNTSMNAGLPSLTDFQRHKEYLQSNFFTARASDGISQEDLDRAMNPLNEVVEPFTKKQKTDK